MFIHLGSVQCTFTQMGAGLHVLGNTEEMKSDSLAIISHITWTIELKVWSYRGYHFQGLLFYTINLKQYKCYTYICFLISTTFYQLTSVN